MLFRTEVKIPVSDFKISHKDKIALIGSCFSQNIGQKISEEAFSINLNPFGILFNPISIAQSLEAILKNKIFIEEDLYNIDDRWVSLAHHSEFDGLTKETCLSAINKSIRSANEFYKDANTLIITLGTAWVYTHNISREIVANCHKIPNSQFTKRLLTVDEVVNCFKTTLDLYFQSNKQLKVIFTISPVRHWKDGVVENNRSKAVLQLAVQELTEVFNNVSYFPSYEIVMDELRDYRFYESDLLHPNQQAVNYIYDKFRTTFFNLETVSITKEVVKLKKALAHKAFNPNSEAHKKFLQKTKANVKAVKAKYPYLNFK